MLRKFATAAIASSQWPSPLRREVRWQRCSSTQLISGGDRFLAESVDFSVRPAGGAMRSDLAGILGRLRRRLRFASI
jgi:hypothetical protein